MFHRGSKLVTKKLSHQLKVSRFLSDVDGNELKLPVSYEDIARAYIRISDGIKRTVNKLILVSIMKYFNNT